MRRIRPLALVALLILSCGQLSAHKARPARIPVRPNGTPAQLKALAQSFPPLNDLTRILESRYKISQMADPSMVNKASSNSSKAGWMAGILRGWVTDNITLKVDAAYSKTLAANPTTDGVLAPLSVSKVTFIPTYEATWQMPLSKLVTGYRQAHAAKYLKQALRDANDAKMASLLVPYADFDAARAKFSEKSTCDNFYSMKSKALAVFAAAGMSGCDLRVQHWVEAECISSDTTPETASK